MLTIESFIFAILAPPKRDACEFQGPLVYILRLAGLIVSATLPLLLRCGQYVPVLAFADMRLTLHSPGTGDSEA
jgi:hypothetical protein